MLGNDTLLFTEKGFKRVDEVNLYDEILTPYGTFEPIIELGDWGKVDRVVKLSTDETIACTDDCLWGGNATLLYTDEIKDSFALMNTKPIKPRKKCLRSSAYDYAVVVPTGVPIEYLMADISVKVEFLAGLIDSPITELHFGKEGDTTSYYKLYTTYIPLERDIITLGRVMGLNVGCKHDRNLAIITLYNNLNYDIPVKDEYKKQNNECNSSLHLKIVDTATIDDKYALYGRKIRVNGGLFLAGYSLVPVTCV